MPKRSHSALRLRLAAAVALSIAALPARASAQIGPEPVRFAWVRGEGADGCADQQHVADQVSARLGKSPFSADASRSIEAIVRRTDRGFHVVLYVRGSGGALAGSRELTSEASDCASIEAASVLAIALAIDPDAAARPPPAPASLPALAPSASHASPAVASSSSPPPAGPPPTPFAAPSPFAGPPLAPPLPAMLPSTPSETRTVRGPPAIVEGLGGSGIAFRASVGVGLLPKVAPGVELAGHAAVGERVQLTGEALWMPEARTADDHFGFGLAGFALGACVIAVRGAAADLAACASVWGGALHAVVYDVVPVAPGDSPWAAGAATPRLRVRLARHVHLELGADVIVPFTRHPFVLRGMSDPVFQQTPVTVSPFAGLGANFP